MNSFLKKLLLPVVVIAAFAGYVIYGRTSGAAAPGIPVTAATDTPAAASSSVSAQASTSAAVSIPKYKDGTYTGTIADAYYGNLQVQAVVTDGAISDIQFLQYPDASGHTMQVSQKTLPLLKTEAIEAQSANVDIVSGATQTSQAFQQSLAAALSQAS